MSPFCSLVIVVDVLVRIEMSFRAIGLLFSAVWA